MILSQNLFLGALLSLKLYIILSLFLPRLFFFTTNLHKSDNHVTEPTLGLFFKSSVTLKLPPNSSISSHINYKDKKQPHSFSKYLKNNL